MTRKIIAIAIVLVMTFSLASCSKAKIAGGEGVIPPVPKEGKAELIILIDSEDYKDLSANGWLFTYIVKFKQEFGVDVKFEQLKQNRSKFTDEARDEYLKKLFVKLTTKNGPDLIFNRSIDLGPLLEQTAVSDLRGKVANLEKIYDSLLSEAVYYIPVGVSYIGLQINRAALAELTADEPGIHWLPEDFYAVRNKWISNNKVLFGRYEYHRAFYQFIELESLYDSEEEKVILNTPEVRQKINNLRGYILGGNFQLINGYKYENYYNMLWEPESEEWKKEFNASVEADRSDHLDYGQMTNLLRVNEVQLGINKYAIIKDPFFMHRKDLMATSRSVLLNSYGFLVNRNAKNPGLAYEFINGLLSNEVQMAMFENEHRFYDFYPVNKEIEADILKLEAEGNYDPRAIEVKAFALQELKNGKCILGTTEKPEISNIYKLEQMIMKDLTKFILADNPYSDEQLQIELKKMEDKYNIYLNE